MNNDLAITVILFWAGFVSSISFMEAWLKFRAEGVNLTIGLSIGKKIFRALNRVEWVFFACFNLAWLTGSYSGIRSLAVLSLLLLSILVAQTLFLLPQMEKRADLIISGNALPKSFHHLWFAMLELLKVGLLLGTGFWLLNFK